MKRITATIFFLMLMMISTVDAARIDAYRDILIAGRYTIRCENLTPASRVTNRTKMELYGKSGLAVDSNDFFINRPVSNIVVGNGEDRYEEVGYSDFYQCRLVLRGENFFFTRYPTKDGGVEYFGHKKGKVAANSRNYMGELINGESFGDEDFSMMLNAMLDSERYQFVSDGVLENNLAFEDFKSASEDGMLSAIRYYFDDNRLVKIAFASYGRDRNGKAQGNKCIVRISEFRAEPDMNLLKLPGGLEDVTKR